MRRRHRKRGTLRAPMGPNRVRRSNAWAILRYVILFAAVGLGVLAIIMFGFPLVEDLIKGVDPSLRYQPKVEADFNLQQEEEQTGSLQPREMYLSDFADYKIRIKNNPYLDGDNIIFTTQSDQTTSFQLDKVLLYNTQTGEATELPGVEKKYDNLLSPMISGNIAVWIDSMADGGGRIVGYDLETNQQFLIKEYAYAIPELSIAGDTLAFMQWAGNTTQRLYVYNLRTRQEATVKLYETETGNSAASVSMSDLVWAEYDEDGNGTLCRISFEGDSSKYDNYDFGNRVFAPKTNGKDIVFATAKDIISGDLMLSTNGGEPVKIAENVTNYELGDNFVAYTKDQKVNICYTNAQRTQVLTPEISKNLLASANENAVCYYDTTDRDATAVADEVVWYAYLE